MNYLFIALLCFVSIIANAQKKTTPNKTVDATKNWLLYKDSTDNFSFKYPTDWTIRIAEATEKAKVFVRSPSEGKDDLFTENLNVMLRPVSVQTIPAKDLQNSIKGALATKVKDFVLIKDKIFTWNGTQAYQIEYTATQKSGEEEMPVWTVQILTVKKGVLYTLTYVSSQDGPVDFYNKALQIINSFKIK
jgi:PsbP-like protein